MAKIILSEPDGPYSAMLDTEVMDVNIKEVYKGLTFETVRDEELTVFMRDGGYELTYRVPEAEEDLVIECKGGDVYINGSRAWLRSRKGEL